MRKTGRCFCAPLQSTGHGAQHSVFFFLSGVDYRSPPHVEPSLHSSRPSHVRCSFPYSLSPMHIHSAALDGLLYPKHATIWVVTFFVGYPPPPLVSIMM